MVFEEDSEHEFGRSFNDCDLTIMNIRLDRSVLKQALGNGEISIVLDSNWNDSLKRPAGACVGIETASKVELFGLKINQRR